MKSFILALLLAPAVLAYMPARSGPVAIRAAVRSTSNIEMMVRFA